MAHPPHAHADDAVCDLGLLNEDGSLVGVLEGVTTYSRPGAPS